jgi:hypothetical protein
MFHPNRYRVHDAWIVFKLNDIPVRTERDGALNFIALIDVASCYMLGTELVAADAAELPKFAAKRLLKLGESKAQRLPIALFIPHELSAPLLAAEADRQGIEVVAIGEAKLVSVIEGAREGFREHFGKARRH